MKKRHAWLGGSGAGLSAIIELDAKMSFLLDRQQAINLTPLVPASPGGYIWRRVFLRGNGHRAGL